MARQKRIEFPGALYHVTSRGNSRQNIYRNQKDRNTFLRILASTIKRYNWRCHAYCLMDNHYHLLIETPNANLAKGMRQINSIYTQTYHRNHKTVGHIFQGRYHALLIEQDPYLLAVARYIVLNPVRAHLVKKPEEWPWSSYLATSGKCQAPLWLTISWILGQFHEKVPFARRAYSRFVLNGINTTSPFMEIEEGNILGFPQFVAWIREIDDKASSKEIPKIQQLQITPSLKQLFTHDVLADRSLRNATIVMAHVDAGYTQKAIADHLNMHYASISRLISLQCELKYKT